MPTGIRRFTGDDLLAHTAALHSVYADAFCAPPWNEEEEQADEFVGRLAGNVHRPGFTAALALTGSDVAGFATDRCYPQAAAGLGTERTLQWLCGAREIDELALRPAARGTGLAAALLHAVTAGAPEGRTWLLTSVRAPKAVAFCRRQGWTQATHPSPQGNGIAVFLGPHHPARTAAAQPLRPPRNSTRTQARRPPAPGPP